jgi:hypothetical protein
VNVSDSACDTVPDVIMLYRVTEALRTRYPDTVQFISFLTRSNDYVRTLPLGGLIEDYSRNYPELFDLAF